MTQRRFLIVTFEFIAKIYELLKVDLGISDSIKKP